MKVVRFTFDVCFKSGMLQDVYAAAGRIEDAIKKVDWVCGCEVKESHALRANGVDVDAVIEKQHQEVRDDKAPEGKQPVPKMSDIELACVNAICDDCARALGFVQKDKISGMWMGECEVCHKEMPCSDLWHDWHRPKGE